MNRNNFECIVSHSNVRSILEFTGDCMVTVEQTMASRKRFSLNKIVDYVWSKEYANDMYKTNYGLEFNGRRIASTFTIMN